MQSGSAMTFCWENYDYFSVCIMSYDYDKQNKPSVRSDYVGSSVLLFEQW